MNENQYAQLLEQISSVSLQVAKLSSKVAELTNSIRGDSLGSTGLVSRVARLEAKVQVLEDVLNGLRTGLRIVQWVAAAGGALGAGALVNHFAEILK
jgi:predicted  nucleic acid-binding Zn-ribbon protein